ncbi:Aste57867_829 [Aphanomyces stellatus]|uniref:Aste57867_829 protein n=1 Tax=Aphanomyces stellatus TaxID=120398 RepID=A0A485K3Z3_9STRA|nr:hypothetical protein As57867_000828 [Aphanomyces stellatus]VFT78053.1 Aste57867_829 [Aphanomyces stellatus]
MMAAAAAEAAATATITAKHEMPLDNFDMLDESLVDIDAAADNSRHSDSAHSLRDSILEDELAHTKAALAEMTRTCHELQFQVKQLEAAKLLWDVTRLGMEFQVIKDKDNHNRVRNRLEDELIRAQTTAKHFHAEATKLKDEMSAANLLLDEMEGQVRLLQSNNDMHLRLKQLEAQVQQLTATNSSLIDENHVLKLHKYELEQELGPVSVQRTSSWKLFQKSSQPRSSSGVTLFKKTPSSVGGGGLGQKKASETLPPARASKPKAGIADHELLKLLQRELRTERSDSTATVPGGALNRSRLNSLDLWF